MYSRSVIQLKNTAFIFPMKVKICKCWEPFFTVYKVSSFSMKGLKQLNQLNKFIYQSLKLRSFSINIAYMQYNSSPLKGLL